MGLTSSKKIEANRYELEISVSAGDFKAAVDRAFKKNMPKITLPGFRKGKAPRALVERTYGKEVFYEDAINELYPTAYDAAIKEAKLEPVDRADVEVVSADENGFIFKAGVTVKPEVAIEGYKGVEAVKTVYAVSQKDIDDSIELLRERNSRMVPVENRPAQDGDTTVIDFEGFADDVAFEGGKGENHTLVLGSGQFIPGFEEQIVGKSIGETFDVNVTFPEEYHAEELKGKPAVFKVTLKELTEKEMPALDDEFAKDVSEFDTLEELRSDIEKKLSEQNEEKSKRELENAVIDVLTEKMEADIPRVMIDNKVRELMGDFERRIQSQGIDLNTYLAYTGMKDDVFAKTFEEPAEKQVKTRLVLEKIGRLENLEASAGEIEEEYTRISDMYSVDIAQVKMLVSEEDIAGDIVANKAIDLVVENAKVEERPAEEAEKAAEKPEASEKE